METTIFYVISYASSLSHIIPCVLAILNFKRLHLFSRVLFYYAIFALFFEFLMWLTMRFNIENTVIINLYTPIEITIWIVFFYRFFETNSVNIRPILYFIPLFFMFSFIEFKLGDNLSRINYTESLGALFISAMALLSFRHLILHRIYDNLTDASFFYFNCGALIYFLGNLCFFATSNLIDKTEAHYWMAFNMIHALLNITLNSLLSVGFLKTNKS